MKVLQILSAEAEVVCLVRLPERIEAYQYPNYLEYSHPNVVGICPCLKIDGKYQDLRTGMVVERIGNTLEWGNSLGTVFHYPDGYEILLSRRIGDRCRILLDKEEFKFSNQSMVRINVR